MLHDAVFVEASAYRADRLVGERNIVRSKVCVDLCLNEVFAEDDAATLPVQESMASFSTHLATALPYSDPNL